MAPVTRRSSCLLLACTSVVSSGCASGDSASTSTSASALPASAGASTPPALSLAASAREPASSASSGTSAASSASADAHECQADADCVLLSEDACCVPTMCDQDRQALSKARAEEKHLQCARKDCHVPARKNCSVADVRVVAACRQGRCVMFEPGVGGTGRIREPHPSR